MDLLVLYSERIDVGCDRSAQIGQPPRTSSGAAA
jgi:hypothetical protein